VTDFKKITEAILKQMASNWGTSLKAQKKKTAAARKEQAQKGFCENVLLPVFLELSSPKKLTSKKKKKFKQRGGEGESMANQERARLFWDNLKKNVTLSGPRSGWEDQEFWGGGGLLLN